MSYLAADTRYDGRMPYRPSGRCGLKLPLLSLGFWHNFGTHQDYDNMKAMCFAAFDEGVVHFDLANNYGPDPGAAELNFGRILKEEMKAYRDELCISTKAGYEMWPGPYGDFGSRKYLLSSLDASLKRMGLPYVDIFYHHRMDKDTPLEESMMALDQAVKSGRALYAGLSNYDAKTMLEAAAILKELRCPFIINQVRYSIFDRHIESDGLKQASEKLGVGLIAFSPLAQGMLSDRYLQGVPNDSRVNTDGRFLKQSQITDEKLAQIRELNEIAKGRGQSLAQMSLAWILKDGAFQSVLIGASKPEQILENCGFVKNLHFSESEIAAIDKASGMTK